MESIKENPFLGIGIGNWKIKSMKYDAKYSTGYRVPFHAHNDFLQVAAESGILASIFFVLFLLYPFYIFIKHKIYYLMDLKYFSILLMMLVYILDTLINFPIARPISLILDFCFNNINFLANKEKNYLIFIFILLLTNLFVSYKLYRSSILQSVILNDYNNRTFSITPDIFDKFDISFPNISQTTVPIKLLKGRYYKHYDSIQSAIKLFKESIELNPYLMMAEGEISMAYYDLQQFDSAYYYGKKAFYTLPNNNTHRYSYFQALVNKRDSVELDKLLN